MIQELYADAEGRGGELLRLEHFRETNRVV